MKNPLASYSIFCFILLCLFPLQLFAEDEASFSQAELDQMMAPIALYPDSLLSQILMASTYPANVAEAVKWSKANPEQQGDAAVTAVQDKAWDPSVMSLVAFPQVLEMMGKQPDWVQNLGDAFLANPDKVMDSAQKLRKKAKEEGNLKTTEQQTVVVEKEASETIIIIEPADPKVVYVPVYNPTIVYGSWWWPHYTPYYYHPVGYNPVLAGIGFGIGVGITRSLWGGCNWRRGDVDINVNRYNNININNKINSNNRSTNWKHNNKNRQGVPYRDKNSRQKYNNKKSGRNDRNNYRGRDKTPSQRDAARQKAQKTLKNRGADPVSGRKQLSGKSGDKIRKESNKITRQNQNRSRTQSTGNKTTRNKAARDKPSSRKNTASQNRNRNNALSGVRNSDRTSRNIKRGSSSRQSSRSSRSGNRGGGHRGGSRR